MRLIKFRITNFQSFSDSGELEFAEDFNLIIGQNNAGKSSLLKAMLPSLPDDRHRTPEKWEDFRLPFPRAYFTIEISGEKLTSLMLKKGGGSYAIPAPVSSEGEVRTFAMNFLKQPAIEMAVTRNPNQLFQGTYPSHGLFTHTPNNPQICAWAVPQEGEIQLSLKNRAEDSLPDLLWEGWSNDMFYFAAERMTVGEAAVGHGLRLAPNAQNLPNVLHTLQTERGDVFDRLVGHVREIFSTVGNLSVRINPSSGGLEVRVWPTEARSNVELSFPLNGSGTGVSQVIAILTAIMTTSDSVIIIDEINSFLHPAAVKALLRILQTEYAGHQYIISTHAPEVIGFSNPKTIHLVRREGYESSVERLDLAKVEEFRGVAEHLGISMADVFAAERVIWVEGPTEELCFPYLYREMSGQPIPRGTIFTSVAATGDFNRKRDRQIVYEVYSRLCRASATLVVSILFSFDTEELTEAEKVQMTRDAGGKLHFLPRRHIECYLLDAQAIAEMIAEKDEGSSVSAEAVEAKLRELAADKRFRVEAWNGDLHDAGWLAKVDAAKLIVHATDELSEQRASFTKKEDSLGLLQKILGRNPEQLSPLYDYVSSLVAGVSS